MDQELTSMKMDKKDMKDTAVEQPTTLGSSPKGPQYPWGLGVTLENESLKKMGVKLSDYKVGDVVELYAQCKVTRLSESQNEHDKHMNRTMELQITDMCLEATDTEAEAKKEMDDGMGWDEDAQSADKKLKDKGY